MIRRLSKIYNYALSFQSIYFLYTTLFKIISQIIILFVNENRNLIIFGAANGIHYNDNSKYLFEWINSNINNIQCVWLTHRKSIKKHIVQYGYQAELTWSINGVKYLFSAKIGCFTNSLRDLSVDPWLFPDKIKLIALRHGKSVKKVREALEGFKLTKVEKKSRDLEKSKIAFVISTSNFISEITAKSIGIQKNFIKVTGFPRNDSFYNHNKNDEVNYLTIKNEINKVILYAPSWRHGVKPTQFFPFYDFNKGKLFDLLQMNNVQILFRQHPAEAIKFPEVKSYLDSMCNESKYLRVADSNSIPDIFDLLSLVDCLITDYSASYHDFLLTDKPMWFTPYDYEYFSDQFGFHYDYFKLLPGPHLESFTDFINELNNLCEGIDIYSEKRQELCGIIHKYKDGKSSKRVYELIDSIN